MPSFILIRYRFTNDRLSTSIETIGRPLLARSLLTLIFIYVFKTKACLPFNILFLQVSLLGKKSYYYQYFLKHRFKHASRIERFTSIDD